ncbi:MAG: sigma-70 family RNA polymerase sigma factor [Caldilineaceae bacterium]|nr:sigma-70 family RNA polymerase sigma factor [Caldilineaceae bacterium]
MPIHQEAALVRRLCTGDPAAWTQVVDRWNERVYSYVIYNVATEAEAQALTSSIFSELVQTLVGSLPVTNLTILIFSIAHQQVLRYRAENADPIRHHALPVIPEADMAATEAATFLAFLSKFTPEFQQVLLLHYLCGITTADIAAIVGHSEEWLVKYLFRLHYESAARTEQAMREL